MVSHISHNVVAFDTFSLLRWQWCCGNITFERFAGRGEHTDRTCKFHGAISRKEAIATHASKQIKAHKQTNKLDMKPSPSCIRCRQPALRVVVLIPLNHDCTRDAQVTEIAFGLTSHVRLPGHLLGGSQKGGFQKGGFGGRSLVPKTGTRAHSDVPRHQQPERGYIGMFPGTKNRSEGTFTKTTLFRNRPFFLSSQDFHFLLQNPRTPEGFQKGLRRGFWRGLWNPFWNPSGV